MNALNPTTTTFGCGKTIRGWVLYDGECPLCVAAAEKFAPLLRRHCFELAPLQRPWVQERLGLKTGAPLSEMKLLAADGTIWGGADALLQIARRIWWAWPLFALAQIPGMTALLRAIYRRVAANRHCFNGKCTTQQSFRRRHTTFFEMP